MMRDSSGKKPFALVAAVIVVAAVAGLLAGVLICRRLDVRAGENEKFAQIDEYQGLAQRSGITGDLTLDVEPASQTVRPGAPLRLTVRLTNRSKRVLTLNSWIEPYPAMLGSNQLPLKVDIRLRREPVTYHGDSVILPLHTRNDFLTLRPGESKSTVIDITKPASGRGRWDLSTHGTYEIAFWYETYLSGKWIDVNAWTGMTNPYVVQVVVGG
jgi:hypothetical protein